MKYPVKASTTFESSKDNNPACIGVLLPGGLAAHESILVGKLFGKPLTPFCRGFSKDTRPQQLGPDPRPAVSQALA
jgi:hypothetical protein